MLGWYGLGQGLLYSLLGTTALSRNVVAQEPQCSNATSELTNNYILLHHKSLDLSNINSTFKVALNSSHEYTIADLSQVQVKQLTDRLLNTKGMLRTNKKHKRVQSISSAVTNSKQEVSGNSIYMQEPISCPKCDTSNVKFVLMDSLIYPNAIPKGITFQYGPNYVDATPCSIHGSVVLNEITPTTIQPKFVDVTNVAVFNCGDASDDSIFIQGFTWLKNFTLANNAKKLRTIVNLDWGSFDEIVQPAIQEAINVGAIMVFAAGNEFGVNICNFDTNFKGAMRVGATDTQIVNKKTGARAPGDTLAIFSNVGPCVLQYAPGYIHSTYTGKEFLGSSGSAPLITAEIACVVGENPQATTQQLFNAVIANSAVIYPASGQNAGTATNVKLKTTYCNSLPIASSQVPAVLFTKLATTGTKIIWFQTNQTQSCVNFTASSSQGASVTTFSNQLKTVNITVSIGAKIQNSSKYKHSISINGEVLNSSITSGRILPIASAAPVLFRVSQSNQTLSVAYSKNGNLIELVSVTDPYSDMGWVGFAGNGVTYKKALTCT